MTPSKRSKAPRIYLLDGHSLSYRAFFALPTTLATTTGQVTNAVYGFTSMLIKLLGDEHPDYLAVAFDRGRPTVRLEKYEDYKAGRPEPPSEFRGQIGLIKEVLATLEVPIVEVDGHEADDAIATLATRALADGMEVTIVTADKDFFQLVRPGITVLFNRKGISDIVRYDEAAVEERFGLPPSKYLDFVALKGDPSDNIPGVPGVGDKTAAKLVNEFGTVEALAAGTDQLKGKQRENIEAAADQLALNKDLARLQTDLDLDVGPSDCVMGGWDRDEVRQLFTSLEFRSLLERLEDAMPAGPAGGTAGGPGADGAAEVPELDLSTAKLAEVVNGIATTETKAVSVRIEDQRISAVGVSQGGGVGFAAEVPKPTRGLLDALAKLGAAKWTHDAKEMSTAVTRSGGEVRGVAFDTVLAGYLLDPSAGSYTLGHLTATYLGVDLVAPLAEEDGQLFGEPTKQTAGEAAAIALLVPVMSDRVERAGLRDLLDDVELPLTSVLAGMQARGIALDTDYLAEMSGGIRERMATLRARIYELAGEEFNLNSPPQLRLILYDKLGLTPGKKTPKGELSTDASVLEKLRDEHEIVDDLLQWRELDKLNSTYLEALPKLVDPEDGRIHTTFNQTVAATGRLSSSDPNLQNIPIRSDLGRQIRRAFVPGDPDGQLLLVADYSQIELRILAHLSGDEGLREAFASGEDIHTATAAAVFELPIDAVDQESRRRAKMVNYGLAYGMNAWGLAQRLQIAVDEAQEIMDAYFESFPSIHDYLERQVTRATADGYTETMLGRRRYIPELQAGNPRMRDLGRRQALNAPIQGSASDVFKVAMIAVDRALAAESGLDCHMLLTVHDELVFEVASTQIEAAAELVKREMETCVDLDVALRADVGWGPNWADAAPEGH